MGRDLDSYFACSGCGHVLPAEEPRPFSCPQRGDGGDHVLVRHFFDADRHRELLSAALEDRNRLPFVRFRRLFHSWQVARRAGMSDEEYVDRVENLNARVAEVDGHGFFETPLVVPDRLAAALHRDPGSIWVKNETVNVSGSHKARHLFQVAIWLETIEALGWTGERDSAPLAIASCGNAALAAAVVARALERRLLVFVPVDADAAVLRRIRELGAEVQVCPREGRRAGDPCLHAFHEGLRQGALPFGCQGPENGVTIEGGLSLGYEIVGQGFLRVPAPREVVVQVGGGALATGVFQALLEAEDLGLLPEPLPRLHTVQTTGASPLERAHRLVEDRLSRGGGSASSLDEVLSHAATHRDQFMWPWESPPQSCATGILDDETYDWLGLLRGMLRSRGRSVVASEDCLQRAHALARSETGIDVSVTGAAGLAGWMTLVESGGADASAPALVIFSGIER